MDKLNEKILEVIAATAPLVLAYFAGIAYLSAYLAKFSISVHEVDLPIPIVLSYSFNVFSNPVFLLASIGLAIVALLALSDAKLKSVVATRSGLAVIMIIGVFVAGLLINKIAQVAADQRSEKVLSGDTAWVSFKAPFSKYEFEMSASTALRFERCRTGLLHILTTDKYTYAVCRATPTEGLLLVQSNDGTGFLPLREFKL
ncbi:hypothetical protein [Phyllobacterium sp. UNC302MFCol5.2]|uniref:hypothetical protein n=1 Tax=Phyllobacterium sp. UNC302MFCol5.2 TaxID=1449065 RepID=UPI000485757C|nr:hypothetical protein [Phyllobacterium sp. UNC302MFCol5.2]